MDGETITLPVKNDYGTNHETDAGRNNVLKIGENDGNIWEYDYYSHPEKYEVSDRYKSVIENTSADFTKSAGIELLDRKIDLILGGKWEMIDKLDKSLSLSEDADLYRYGYEGARKRFIINSITNSGFIYMGRKVGWISSFGLEDRITALKKQFSEKVAPEISRNEAKKEIERRRKEAEEEIQNHMH